MKKSVLILAGLLCMSAGGPALADMTAAQKDECLLASRNCSNAVDDIQQKIKKITNEIQKGTKVYTAQELKKLEQKLADVKELLDDMQKH